MNHNRVVELSWDIESMALFELDKVFGVPDSFFEALQLFSCACVCVSKHVMIKQTHNIISPVNIKVSHPIHVQNYTIVRAMTRFKLNIVI